MIKVIANKKSIIIYVFLLNIFLIFGINYLVGTIKSDNLYGLSNNHILIEPKAGEKFKYKDLEFLKRYNDIIVVAETNKDNLIGLYDPSMEYYIFSTKFVNPKDYRYFSYDDYKSNSKVGILIDSVDKIKEYGLNSIDISYLENDYDIKIINIFDTNSKIYRDKLRIVQNLFSMGEQEIDYISIDSDNLNEIHEIKNYFIKLDYEEINKKDDFIIMYLLETIKTSY